MPVNSLSKCKAKLGCLSEAKRRFPLTKVTERIIRGDHYRSQCWSGHGRPCLSRYSQPTQVKLLTESYQSQAKSLEAALCVTGSHSECARKGHMTALLTLVPNFAAEVVLVSEPGLSLKRTLSHMQSDGLHKAELSGSPLVKLPALICQRLHMARHGIISPMT